jgi:hypothetical protein
VWATSLANIVCKKIVPGDPYGCSLFSESEASSLGNTAPYVKSGNGKYASVAYWSADYIPNNFGTFKNTQKVIDSPSMFRKYD